MDFVLLFDFFLIPLPHTKSQCQKLFLKLWFIKINIYQYNKNVVSCINSYDYLQFEMSDLS